MECPNCGATVPPGKFCVECGTALPGRCPDCGAPNPPTAKFCAECGASLRAVPNAKAAAGAPAPAPLPPRAAAEAERRQLTVLFCDLVGSTELAARLDPEDLRAVMGAYHRCAADVVERFEGYVANYLGDGVLAYFGWPRAHEDDAERAVRAGLALVEAVGGLRPHADTQLQARVGIATGLAVVGELISDGTAREESVVGETPNLAARLETLADPGSVVISQPTRRLVGSLFVLDALGPQRLKGFAEPVPAWRVLAAARSKSRFDALRGERLTPLIGREHELGLLVDRWERTKQGEGQVVLLSGEPGIGKSRVVRALRERLADERYVALNHYCAPNHQNTPLHPVIGLLERAAGLSHGEPREVRLDKLEALLARGTERLDEAVPLLADLLSIPTDGRWPRPDLRPQQQKEKTLGLLLEQVEGLAAAEPVLAVYEDVHWIDPTTLELLGALIERVRELPVLVLITFRPEFRPPWGGSGHTTQLSLSRLPRRHGAAMVGRVTDGKPMPAELVEQIVARADGIPLFVEELTKTVLESDLVRDAGDRYELTGPLVPLAIPATLHDSLMARLDRLAPNKEVAQIGAVIGREFSHELLATVAPLPEAELDLALEQLVNSGLIFCRGTPPDASYRFKHALVQDVARQSLLKTKRKQLHARIALTLTHRPSATIDTQPEIVAYHFSEAGMAEQAVEYWHRAGERAVRRSANAEAIRHLEAALELLPSLPEDRTRAERELRLLTLLSPAQMVTKSRAAEELAATLERARRVAQELESLDHLIPATLGLWLLNMSRGALKRADELTRELFDLARQGDDDGFVLQAHHAAWTIPMFMGDFLKVRHHVECGLALYDRQRHGNHAFLYLGHDPQVCAHALGSVALWMLGHIDQALDHSTAAVASAEELEHPPTLVHALSFAGILHVLRGDHEATATVAERLFSIASQLNMVPGIATADSLAGWAMVQQGKLGEGFPRLEQSIQAWQAMGARLHLPQRLSMLADGLSSTGRLQEALDTNAEAHRLTESTGERWYQAMIQWQRGRLLTPKDGDAGASEAAFRESLALAQAQQAKSLELRAATSLAHLWRDQGEQRRAYELLAPICDWFTEGRETRELKDAEALLDTLR